MPTLEELLNSKDQSLGSFSSSEDESVVDESSLTPEELSAATALGISTKRLSKKAYADLQKKAEGIVKQASIKPEKTTQELAESLVKKGGKSAEASAKQFVKAQPSLGFPTKDVAEAVGDSIPSDVLKPATQTPLTKSPLLSRIATMASSPAGKSVLKSLGLAGAVSGLYGNLSEEQDEPVGAQMSAKELAPGHYVTSSSVESGDATKKYPSKQHASSAYDSLDQIKKDAQSQPMTPKYVDAYTEMLNQRSKFLDNLNTEQVWQGNTSRPLTDEEKEERYAKYEAGLLGAENLAKRASLMVEQKETQQKELEGQLAQIDSQINTSTNPFVVQRLNKEKNNLLATLSNLTSSSSEESSKTPASLTREPSEFVQELMSRPATQMPQQPAVEQPQTSEAESLKPTKRTISAGEPSAIDVQKRDREESLSKIIGAEAARQVAEQESLLARFKQAQQRENLAQLGISLGQAGEKFGSSLAMVKPGDQSFYDQQRKLASGFAEQVKDEEAVRQEAEKNDPNSALSKQYQELVKSMGIPVKGNESAATLIKALPFIQQYQSQKENREARREMAALKREEIAASKEQRKEEKLGGFIKDARNFATTGEMGKIRTRLVKAENSIELFDKYSKGSPTGAKDLAGFFGFMKGVQQDDSVIREAEARLGLSLGSLSSRMQGQLAKFFRGEMFAPEQRQQMLEVLKIQADQLKREYTDGLKPVYEDLKVQPGMTKKDAKTEIKRITSLDLNFGDESEKESESSKKAQITLPEKSAARLKPGQTFELKSSGKTFRVNADGKTATEL